MNETEKKRELPRQEMSGRHFALGCALVALGVLIFLSILIAFYTFLAHHNPKPEWSSLSSALRRVA